MRRAIIQVSPDFIGMMSRPMEKVTLEIKSDVPEGAEFISAYYSFRRNCFLVCFEHNSFDDIPDGVELPILDSPIFIKGDPMYHG